MTGNDKEVEFIHNLAGLLAVSDKSSCEGMHRSVFQHASFTLKLVKETTPYKTK